MKPVKRYEAKPLYTIHVMSSPSDKDNVYVIREDGKKEIGFIHSKKMAERITAMLNKNNHGE